MCHKFEFSHKRGAEHVIRVLKKSGRIVSSDFHAYRCPYCGYWHLGHYNKFLKNNKSSEVKV